MRQAFLLWRLVTLLMVGLAPSASFAREALPRSVLIIDQSVAGRPPHMSSGFQSTLHAPPSVPVSVYVETLDFFRFRGPNYESILQAYLQEKYRDKSIGLVVAIGLLGLEYVLRWREELWPGTPVLFAGADEANVNRLNLPHDVTGSTMRMSPRNAVTAARALVPRLKRVALVGDPFERQMAYRHFKDELSEVAAELEIIDLTGQSMSEVRRRVASLPDDAAIIYTLFVNDGATSYAPGHALALVAEVANRPIVVDFEQFLVRGVAGGFLIDTALIGRDAARLALRILDGENVSEMPITAGDFARPVFDWRELRRWNVSEDRLPPGSEVRFRQPGLWEQYKGYVLAAVALCVIQAAFIVALLVNRRRLHASEQRMSLAADAADLRFWVWEIPSDQVWATRTGRKTLDWPPSRPLTFEQLMERVHADDRESVRRAVQWSLEGRGDFEADYRLVVPGLHERWIAARGRCEFDRDGKPLRMRGVSLDITERRQAEETARELSGRLINVQEEERSRLARELHDDVTQRLALLAIDAGRGEHILPSAAGGKAMGAMREGLIRLSEDVHALSYRLHPTILEDLGLIEALKTECERFGRVASIPVDVKAQEIPEPLPHAVALCLYRITQEALRNVGRHAGASAVQVSLRPLDGGVQLAVRDNGAGFDPAQQRDRPSLGHASMRQRIYQLDGELDVESAPGHGTTVVAWVPLKEEQREPSARAAG